MCIRDSMWAVFGALFNQRGDGIEDFPLFLIIGQLMFNFFRESTSMATVSYTHLPPVKGAGMMVEDAAQLVGILNDKHLI